MFAIRVAQPARRPQGPARSRSSGRRPLAAAWFVACLFAVLVGTASAHAPHDVAGLVAVSPDFANDRTVFGNFVLTDHPLFARSFDGGRDFQLLGQPFLEWGVSGISVSPDHATDGTLIVSTTGGGAWISTDRGLTFSLIASLPAMDVRDVAWSPRYAVDRTLLAATSQGCYRSDDGGASWSPANTGLPGGVLAVIEFADDGSAAPPAFTGLSDLYRSLDLGLTWTKTYTPALPIQTLAVSPDYGTDTTLAIGFGRFGGGLLASGDAGDSFQDVSAGLTDPRVHNIALVPGGAAYCTTQDTGCFRTATLGGTWVPKSDGFEPISSQGLIHFPGLALSPDFASDATLFVSSFEGFYRSDDAAENWSQSDVYNQRLSRRIAFSPAYATDRTLVLGNYGGGPVVGVRGLPVSGKAPGTAAGSAAAAGPGGASPSPGGVGARPPIGGPAGPPLFSQDIWDPRADGIHSLYLDLLSLSPDFEHDDTMFQAYVGLYRSRDRGLTWTRVFPPLFIARSFAWSPQYALDGTVFVGSSEGGIFISADEGDTWTDISAPLPEPSAWAALAVSPGYPDDPLIVAGSKSEGLWRSLDGGANWVQADTGLTDPQIRALELSPAFLDDETLFVGTVGGGLFASYDRGASFVPVNAGLPGALPGGALGSLPLVVEGLAVSPGFARDRTVFVSLLGDGVFRSADGGVTWSAVNAGLPPDGKRVVAVSPAFEVDRTVMVSTHDWAWISADAGNSWTRLPGHFLTDDGHPSVVEEPDWTPVLEAGCHGDGYSVSSQVGEWSQLEFLGDHIGVYGVLRPDGGLAQIEIDGVPVEVVDTSAPGVDPQVLLWEHSFPEVDWHVVRVVNLGAGSTGGTVVGIDAYDVRF